MTRKTDEPATKRRLTSEFGLVAYVNGNLSVGYLRAARRKGVIGNGTPPPPHLKIGTRVLYDLDEVDRWLKERLVQPGAGKAKASSIPSKLKQLQGRQAGEEAA